MSKTANAMRTILVLLVTLALVLGIALSALLTPLVSRPREIREMLDKFTN